MAKKPMTAQEQAKAPVGFIAKITAFRNYLELSRVEFRKVTWPSAKETRTTSLAVLAFVVAMAIFLGLVDLGLSELISLILA